MSNTKLTDLPIELQSRILLNLSPWISPQEAPSKCTLEGAGLFNTILPDSLLHVALASRTLSRSVIDALGSHSRFLNFNRSKRLAEWIFILKDQVKAVSFAGSWKLDYENSCRRDMVRCSCANVKDSFVFKALRALHTNDVALEVLDLQELSKTDARRARETAENVILAMQKSGSSLTEVAMGINIVNVVSMRLVTLPKLNVVQISSGDRTGFEDVALSRTLRSEKNFGHILAAISGNADLERNVCTVRRLRLFNLHDSPFVDYGRCHGLFSSVEKLFIASSKTFKHRDIAIFIANFRNLKSLGWSTEWTCPENMNIIFSGCTDLEDFELYIRNRRIFPGEAIVAQNSSRLKDLFLSFRRKQRGLALNTYLSHEQVLCLARNSPNLICLGMEMDSGNVEALSPLLGTHCRKLHDLRLFYPQEANNVIDRDVWPGLSKAICRASDELRLVSVMTPQYSWIHESSVYEMVEAITNILKFMGDRASYIGFRVQINTHNPFIVLEAVQKVLIVARNHNRSLHALCLNFTPYDQLHDYWIDDSDVQGYMDLLRTVSELRRGFASFKHTPMVNLGDFTALLDNHI